MPIQWLDVILILVMLISAFLAMRQGLIREMLSLVSWAVAALVALFFYQLYRERVRALIGSQVFADLLLVGVVFLIVVLIARVIIDYFLLPPYGPVDRTLGFIFGLVRGFLLVVIAYEVAAALMPKESMPRWVAEARSLPIIERTGRAMLSLLPDNPASIFRSGERSASLSPHERQAALRTRRTHLYIPAGEACRDSCYGWLAEGEDRQRREG
jgi:membrane protein required for colicin V production